MALDKWVAVFFLILSMIYGFAAFNYPLLPFERNMVFLPNTMPMALSVLGAGLSLVVLLTPAARDGEPDIDVSQLGKYNFGQGAGLLGAMVLYALLLRPAGFIPATALFLVGAGWILGERRIFVMTAIAVTGAVTVWLLVDKALGIFLRPLPSFFQ